MSFSNFGFKNIKINAEQTTGHNSGSNLSGVFGGFQTYCNLQSLLTGNRETGRKSLPKLNREP